MYLAYTKDEGVKAGPRHVRGPGRRPNKILVVKDLVRAILQNSRVPMIVEDAPIYSFQKMAF
jgi:hypothetical protein